MSNMRYRIIKISEDDPDLMLNLYYFKSLPYCLGINLLTYEAGYEITINVDAEEEYIAKEKHDKFITTIESILEKK